MSGIDKFASDYLSQTWTGKGDRIKEDEDGNKSSESVDVDQIGTDQYDNVFGTLERTSDKIRGIDRNDNSVWTDAGKDGVIGDVTELDSIFLNSGVDLADGDAEMLYNIIDANGDGIITSDEYEFMMDGDNGITGFSMWRAFSYQDSAFEQDVEKNASTIYTGAVDAKKYDSDPDYKKKIDLLLDDEQKAQLANGQKVKLDFSEGISDTKMSELVSAIIESDGKMTVDDFKDVLNEEDFKELSAIVNDSLDTNSKETKVGSKVYEEIANIEIADDSEYKVDGTTEEQQKIAKYLIDEYDLELTGEDLEAFVKMMPAQADYGTFLRNMAGTYSKGTTLSGTDVQTWMNKNFGISTDVSNLGLSPEDAAAKKEYFDYINDKFALDLTDEQIANLVINDLSLEEIISTIDSSGDQRITDEELKNYLKENGIDMTE